MRECTKPVRNGRAQSLNLCANVSGPGRPVCKMQRKCSTREMYECVMPAVSAATASAALHCAWSALRSSFAVSRPAMWVRSSTSRFASARCPRQSGNTIAWTKRPPDKPDTDPIMQLSPSRALLNNRTNKNGMEIT